MPALSRRTQRSTGDSNHPGDEVEPEIALEICVRWLKIPGNYQVIIPEDVLRS
jgi:hypothetical protein